MSDKINFDGEVGQAVMGGVQEAPRMNNVVNLNIPNLQKETRYITGKQRKVINDLVKEWSAISGRKEVEIYGIFMTDYGVKLFKDLPMEHYAEIKRRLERWLNDARQPQQSPRRPAESLYLPKTLLNEQPASCAACTEKDKHFSRLRITSRLQSVLILALAAGCGFLLYKMPTSSDSSATDNMCFFEGRPYSKGSTIKAAGGALRECTQEAGTGPMTWEIQSKKNNR